jgi:hypothetical protein
MVMLDLQSALRYNNNRRQPGATDTNKVMPFAIYLSARHCRRVGLVSAKMDPVNGVIVY